MVRRGEMTEEMAATHKFKNRITRAIGAESMVRVDFFDADLSDVQRVLLCSDGLTNMVDDVRIESVLNDGTTPQKQAELLLSEALENGGVDNVTLLIIDPTESEESIC
jgi:protein phosphatase